MLTFHLLLLHTIAYTLFPMGFIVSLSTESFEALLWLCILWMFPLQFHMWQIWRTHGRLLRKEDSLYVYIPLISHIGAHIALNTMFYVVHNIFPIGLLSLTVSTLLIDGIGIWIFRRYPEHVL